MAKTKDEQLNGPLLIKRYASRRLYNTQTSDYVTLEDISGFIRSGRDVQIIDLKSGDDLTRQYLLQIIADHEGRGENVLPLDVLTDLVRSYTTDMQSVVPDFLSHSFEMLRTGQAQMMENLNMEGIGIDGIEGLSDAMPSIPGFEVFQAQQEAFLKAMTGGMVANWPTAAGQPSSETKKTSTATNSGEDLSEIKKQLADLQEKLSKLS
jgi:polyhydroxyalkanoate synthesis repressor PhaR